jgi:uncharacterized protein (DUF983 family)
VVVPVCIYLLVGCVTPEPSLTRTLFLGACPRCGTTSIFKGLLSFKSNCPSCGLMLADRDVGDGAVFLVVMFIGFFITLMSVVVEFAYAPSLWVHGALWLPMTMILSVVGLRGTRALMLWVAARSEA